MSGLSAKILNLSFLWATAALLFASGTVHGQPVNPVPVHGQVISTQQDTTRLPVARSRPSLMFTNRDVFALQDAIAQSPLFGGRPTGQSDGAIKSDGFIEDITAYSGGVNLSLSAIVYVDDTNWTIWVNGKSYRPDDNSSFFRVEQIHPRYVDFSVPRVSGIMKPVRLAPNQTFLFRADRVIEGIPK